MAGDRGILQPQTTQHNLQPHTEHYCVTAWIECIIVNCLAKMYIQVQDVQTNYCKLFAFLFSRVSVLCKT